LGGQIVLHTAYRYFAIFVFISLAAQIALYFEGD
jgi:hypothetical protein